MKSSPKFKFIRFRQCTTPTLNEVKIHKIFGTYSDGDNVKKLPVIVMCI